MQNRLFLTVFILFFVNLVFAQNEPTGFMHESLKTQNTGMWVLGGWAAANLVAGAMDGPMLQAIGNTFTS